MKKKKIFSIRVSYEIIITHKKTTTYYKKKIVNTEIVHPVKEGYTVRDVFVPSNPYSPAQIYSIRLSDICEQNNICREGNRALIALINEILADPFLGNFTEYNKLII